jgi:hypothetical protein
VNVPASIERRRVVLESPFQAAFDDYHFPVALLSMPFILFVLGGVQPSRGILVFYSLICVALPLFWIYGTYRSYRLARLDVLGSQEELRERALSAVEELEWAVIEDEEDIIIAHTRAGLTAGQIVTILPVPNALYIGSRNRPGPRGRSPFSFGRDAENLRELREALGTDGVVGQALDP